MAVDDIIEEQDGLKKHTYDMRLWPRQWTAYQNRVPCQWQEKRLEVGSRLSIPETSGVYTLILISGVAGHPFSSYLMYVGQTNNLRERFGQYLTTERGERGRPKIVRLLNLYDSHLWFCYTEAPLTDISTLEDDLMEAFLPPCNSPSRFPASIRPAVGAF
jgi:hypothetical protein